MSSIMADLPAEERVPEAYQGLWRRSLLLDELAGRDATSHVYWLQTGSLYADIRIPADRQSVSRVQCEARSAHVLPMLMQQQGFAGQLEVQGDVLTWHRWLDFQPPTGAQDMGRVRFAGQTLIEEGLHARYTEHWCPVPDAGGGVLALQLQEEGFPDGSRLPREGVLLVSGNYFIYALERAEPFHLQERFVEDYQRNAQPAGFLHRLLDCEIHFGLCDGRSEWEIRHSTLPWCEGRSLIAVTGAFEPEGGDGYRQQVVAGGTARYWNEVERCGAVPALV